jgi:hypothetical protein
MNSKLMKKDRKAAQFKWLSGLVVFSALAGCGGGSSDLLASQDDSLEALARANSTNGKGTGSGKPTKNTTVSEPVASEPAPTEPVSTEPVTTDPVATSPTPVTEPTTDPTISPTTGTTTPTAPTTVVVPKEAFTCATGAITCVEVASTSNQTQASLPVTFGQPFKAGDWYHNTNGLTAKVDGVQIPLQADEISSHINGSARFAVLSAQLNNVQPGQVRIINLFPAAKTTSSAVVPADPDWNLELEANVFDANGNVTATLVALPQAQLKDQIAKNTARRLHGAVASEYTVVTGFKNKSTGEVHPHLTARLHTRLVDGGARMRTDVVMENTRTWTPNPGNITYSFAIKRNGTTLHTQPKFTHYHHARWHKVVWTGSTAEPNARLRHHMPYLLGTKIIWNYDLKIKISETELASALTRLRTKQQEQSALGPMANLFLTPYFPTTGGRAEIGPFPKWVANYIISQDDRALEVMLAHGDAAGAVPIHYRDEATNHVIDLDTHPKVTVRTGNSEPLLPTIASGNSTIWTADTAHQPSLAFVPYIITGDAFYLEEVMFWTGWNIAGMNPQYRGYGSGLLTSDQIRGQAWNMRSLSETIRAIPDSHPLKDYFHSRMTNNMNWYHQQYVTNANLQSPIGAVQKPDEKHLTAPWQNDFLAIVFAQLVDDGQPQALPVLNFMSQLNVGRFINENNGFCVAKAAGYYWKIRDTENRLIDNFRTLYTTNFTSEGCDPSMPIDGYPSSANGAAAFARAMLATAVNSGVPNSTTANSIWLEKTLKMDAAFATDATWAITQRN